MKAVRAIPIGELLREEGLISQEQLTQVLAEQKSKGRLLGELLIERGLVSPEQLVRVLARRLGVRGCVLQTGLADPAMLELIGADEALRLKALPLFRVRGTLTVAMSEPQSLPQIDRLHELTGCKIRPVLAFEANIVEFIKRHSSASADMEGILADLAQADSESADDGKLEGGQLDLDAGRGGSPVVQLVHTVLLRAVRDRASDIHIEPDGTGTRIRCRVDGVLRDLVQPGADMHAAIISRVKVMAGMDIAEKRLPQEGRIAVRAEGRPVDLRVSTIPTLLGEKAVLRILDKGNLRLHLEDLGLRGESLQRVRRMLAQPYGMFLVTGPTGSGKTTTLYSALEALRGPETNVVTVEDPVEYQLDLVNQVQVQASIGMTFARALRSILRQDPDVIMVGEIRDEETAGVSVHAALTGHAVLATLHTNDAASAVARLADMGVEPYLLSSTLNGVIAQRLVRRICVNCSAPCRPEDHVLLDAGLTPADLTGRFSRGTGCEQCRGTGFHGRLGVYEVLEITSELRKLIYQRAPIEEFRQQWRREGGLTLREEGLLLARAGLTTLEEVLGATHSNDQEPAAPPRQAALVG